MAAIVIGVILSLLLVLGSENQKRHDQMQQRCYDLHEFKQPMPDECFNFEKERVRTNDN